MATLFWAWQLMVFEPKVETAAVSSCGSRSTPKPQRRTATSFSLASTRHRVCHPSNWPAVARFTLVLATKPPLPARNGKQPNYHVPSETHFKSQNPDPRVSAHRATAPPTMDLDIEMDVDDVHDAPISAIPQAYTHDIITGEEQVRIGGSLLGPPSATR